jgi:hypothetical protein
MRIWYDTKVFNLGAYMLTMFSRLTGVTRSSCTRIEMGRGGDFNAQRGYHPSTHGNF